MDLRYRCDLVTDPMPGVRRKWTGIGDKEFFDSATLKSVEGWMRFNRPADMEFLIDLKCDVVLDLVDLLHPDGPRVVEWKVLRSAIGTGPVLMNSEPTPTPTPQGMRPEDGTVWLDTNVKNFTIQQQRDIDLAELKERVDRMEGVVSKDNTRRLRVLSVPYSAVLNSILIRGAKLPEYLQVVRAESVPEGAEVISVQDDFFSRSFHFLLWHPSFTPVPDGEPAPRLLLAYTFKVSTVPTPTDIL